MPERIAAEFPVPKPRRRHLLNFTLASLPELELFESSEQRQAALQELGQEASNLRSIHFWWPVITLAVTVAITFRIVPLVLGRMGWPRPLGLSIGYAAAGACAWIVLRALHRAGARKDLRRKLLAQGVPVCLICGYLLRGLSAQSQRCPECGRAFDAQVIDIIQRQRELQPDA